MTTVSTAPDRLPWWRYLGPWPLRPVTFSILVSLATLISSTTSLTFSTLPRYSAAAGASGIVIWLTTSTAQRFFPRGITKFPGYLSVILLLSLLVAIIRIATGTNIVWAFVNPTTNFVLSIMRNTIVALVILAILGLFSRRLQNQIDQTQQALEIVRSQAAALLEADETIRQQVAAALHDRVQAGLIGACMQLQSITPNVRESDADLITRVIDSLEELRSLDVRRAVRSLSPNLHEVDLQSAIEELAETYVPGMITSTRIQAGNAPYEVRLGAYRIIEQSLLNSAMHGLASQAHVSIQERRQMLEVVIQDNGTGLADEVPTGLGSTLISTWCRTLNGTWSRQSPPEGGTVVTAHLPLAS